MTPITDIGEMLISDRERDYFFRPSLVAMARIGSPSEIVAAHATMNGFEVFRLISQASDAWGKVPEWLLKTIKTPVYGRPVLATAMSIMQACCDDDLTSLIGEWRPGKKGVVYRKGKMGIGEIIIIARELIEHGVIGKAKLRKLQKHENKDEYSSEFRVVDYINAARAHFNMPRSEAEQLTMTEFQLMLKAKYPEEKGFTKEEYDAVIDADDKRTAELLSGRRRLVKSKKLPAKAA